MTTYRVRLMPFLLVLALLSLPISEVYSVPPPAHGSYSSGWGMNPNNWETASISAGQWGIYNLTIKSGQGGWMSSKEWQSNGSSKKVRPIHCSANDGSFSNRMVEVPINLELWIEMYGLLTYNYTSYQWHRLGDANETITFVIQGITNSNSEHNIGLFPEADPLTKLKFIEDIFGRTNPLYGSDIDISWRGRWGRDAEYGQEVEFGWEPLIPNPGTGDLILTGIPPCDHWFQFEGNFSIPYHTPDGYYKLEISGCTMPVF